MVENFSWHFSVFTGVVLMLLVFSCGSETGNSKGEYPSKPAPVKDSIHYEPEEETIQKKPSIAYRLDSIQDQQHLDSLQRRFSENALKNIFALNRIDPHRVVPGAKLVLPDSNPEDLEDLMVYSPFPEHLELLDSLPKTLLIAQRIQAFAVYENGNLCRWGPVSSGKQVTPTPNGLHYANYRAKRKISTVNSSWIMPYYINYMNFAGVGTHQYTLPGFPASHACVRLYLDDAHYIYNWTDMWELKNDRIIKNGTPFMVFGTYDFAKPVPWLELVENPRANDLNNSELDTLARYVSRYRKDSLNFSMPTVLEKELIL